MSIKRFLQEPFPYYLESDRKNLTFSAGLGLFVTVNLTLFLPMEWIHILKWIITGLIIFVVLYAHIVWLPKLFPRLIVPDRWTVGKYMLFTLSQLVVIGWTASVVLYATNLYPGLSFRIVVIYYFINMVLYGAVSIVVFTFIIRTVMLKKNLHIAMKANEELRRLMKAPQLPPDDGEGAVTIQSETSETVNVVPSRLLYVESDDNYATLYWQENGVVNKKMVRGNLKSIESQLAQPYIVRCHRSFLVNVRAIAQVAGNTGGYQLSLHDTDISIPLSRGKGPAVLRLLESFGLDSASPRRMTA